MCVQAATALALGDIIEKLEMRTREQHEGLAAYLHEVPHTQTHIEYTHILPMVIYTYTTTRGAAHTHAYTHTTLRIKL